MKIGTNKWERKFGGGEYVSLELDGTEPYIVLALEEGQVVLLPSHARDLALMLEAYADTAEGE